MSILNSILTEQKMFIATDTVCAIANKDGETPYPGVLAGHHSKIMQFPHLKCCVVGMGSSLVSSKHCSFVNDNFFDDMEDMVERTVSEFIPTVPDRGTYVNGEDNMIAALSIFGYHEGEDKLAAYGIQILRGDVIEYKRYDLKVEKGVFTMCTPRLPHEEQEALMPEGSINDAQAVDAMFNICTKLVENSEDREKYLFPVGGQFLMTVISIEGGFYNCMTSNLARFYNWNVTEAKIALFNSQMREAKKLQSEILEIDKKLEHLETL